MKFVKICFLKFICVSVLLFVPLFTFSQSVCVVGSPCGGNPNIPNAWDGNQFNISNPSLSSITDSSAILSATVNTASTNCNVKKKGINTNIKVRVFALWATDCRPVCFSWKNKTIKTKGDKLDTAYIKLNTTVNDWLNGNKVSVPLKGLKANTTYYVRLLLSTEETSKSTVTDCYFGQSRDASAILQFTTLKSVGNNIIECSNTQVCLDGSTSTYQPITITGGQPTGGKGIYTYQWQTRSANEIKWSNCVNGNGINVSSPAINKDKLTSTWQYYRRIVKSGNRSDTSNIVTLTYISQLPFSEDNKRDGFGIGWVKNVTISNVTDTIAVVSGTFKFNEFMNAYNKKFNTGPINSLGANFMLVPYFMVFISTPGNPASKYDKNIKPDTIYIDNSNYNTVGKEIKYSIKMNGLLPNTTFFFETGVEVTQKNECPLTGKETKTIVCDYKTPNLTAESFTTHKQKPPVINNIISINAKTYCPDKKSKKYITDTIYGSTPSGYDQIYVESWQRYIDTVGEWEFIYRLDHSLNVNMNKILPDPLPVFKNPHTVKYRRILFARTINQFINVNTNDTSNVITVNYLPINYKADINVELNNSSKSLMGLQVNSNSIYGFHSVNWYDSLSGSPITKLKTTVKDLYIPLDPTSPNHIYRTEVNFGKSCPYQKSGNIYISPPDGDGNYYPAVKIGNQIWMINNLRATKINNGASIASATNNTGNYYWYNDDSLLYALKYGALYDTAVISKLSDKICPNGWIVAGIMDWYELIEFVGGIEKAGLVLKSPYEWETSEELTDPFNFNALPTGEGLNNKSFDGRGSMATWWDVIPNSQSMGNLFSYSFLQIITGDKGIYKVVPDKLNQNNMKHYMRCFTR